jgi:uncharacterized protein YndB with AHSA1/START domain
MRRYVHEVVVSTAPEKLFRSITDIASWPKWDSELEATEITELGGALVPGTRFSLKPKGAPRVSMSIEAAEAPRRFVDLSHLPLAKMRTAHEFLEEAQGTRIRVTIEVFGPLGFLWDRIVARKQAAGARAQTEAFVRFAEGLP